jgi:hypothetical protein
LNAAEQAIFNKGYLAGYRAGMLDAANGHTIDLEKADNGDIPISATSLSTRAKYL